MIEGLNTYSWGNGCSATELLNSPGLSIKRETMSPGAKEAYHVHSESQQYFFVLYGRATFTVGKVKHEVNENSGIHILPGTAHDVRNQAQTVLEMLVISQPNTSNDRHDIEP